MKKMNNKGVTLVELIVSFAIVGVAVVYFYQTVSTVSKLYKTSKDDTNDYVNSTYVLRLVDAKLDDLKKTYKSTSGKNIDLTKDEAKNNLSSFCSKLSATCTVTNPSSTNTDDNYHKYVISVTTGGKNYKLYRRATIKTKVGTKVETYEKKADSVDLSKASSEDEDDNHGIVYNREGATKISETWNTGSTDCTITGANRELEKNKDGNVKYIDSSVSYERRNHRPIETEEKIILSKTKDGWRTFRPCTSYIPDEQKNYKREFYGTFTATGCTQNIDVTGLKAGMYVVSVVTGDWSDQSSFRCQGVFDGALDSNCKDDTKKQNSLNVNRKVNLSWLTDKSGNHRYNNNSYSGASYLWKIEKHSPVGLSWGLSALSNTVLKKYYMYADTYGTFTRTYNVYAVED